MRTTIEVDDGLFRRAKVLAGLRGMSLKRFFSEALCRELERQQAPESDRRRIELPLVKSSRPASRDLDGDRIAAILNEEELHASS